MGDRPRRSGNEASPPIPAASIPFFHSAPRSVAGAMSPLHSGELRTLRKTSLLLSRWPQEPLNLKYKDINSLYKYTYTIGRYYFLSKGKSQFDLFAYLRFVEIQAGTVGVVLFLVKFHLDAMRGMRGSRGV